MRKNALVLFVASFAVAVLATACVAPPPGGELWTIGSSAKPEVLLRHAITINEPDANVRVSATASVLGPVRFCAQVQSLDPYSDMPTTSACRTVDMVPGTPRSFTLPVTSPTGDEPYDGVVAIRSSVAPSLQTFVLGSVTSGAGSEVGCLGIYFGGDGPWECYV